MLKFIDDQIWNNDADIIGRNTNLRKQIDEPEERYNKMHVDNRISLLNMLIHRSLKLFVDSGKDEKKYSFKDVARDGEGHGNKFSAIDRWFWVIYKRKENTVTCTAYSRDSKNNDNIYHDSFDIEICEEK